MEQGTRAENSILRCKHTRAACVPALDGRSLDVYLLLLTLGGLGDLSDSSRRTCVSVARRRSRMPDVGTRMSNSFVPRCAPNSNFSLQRNSITFKHTLLSQASILFAKGEIPQPT